VAHTCNPSYSGGRDQEDHSWKPAWANTSQDLISEKPIIKRAGGGAQGVGPEFKPQYHKTNKQKQITASDLHNPLSQSLRNSQNDVVLCN
jgi:hypothetical protein